MRRSFYKVKLTYKSNSRKKSESLCTLGNNLAFEEKIWLVILSHTNAPTHKLQEMLLKLLKVFF